MKKTEISIENKPPQNLNITSQDLTSSVKIHDICSIQITVYSETMYVYSICIIKQSGYNIVCHIHCNLFSHVIDIEQYLCLYICRIS
jgi:hypothetical protein